MKQMKLISDQFPIIFLICKKLIMSAYFRHLAVFEKYDLISIPYGAQAMSGNHYRLTLESGVDLVDNVFLIVSIKR